jgi:UDP-3-O-[3-hydroxymyristoyl] glucosamine N-acyltransferase
MAFLTSEQVGDLGLRRVGENVLISDRCVIYDPSRTSIGDNSRVDDFCVLAGRLISGATSMSRSSATLRAAGAASRSATS